MNDIRPIIPYNDIWLDCIKNNLIAMLLQRDATYKDIVYHFGVKYHYKIMDQVYNYDGEKDKFLVEGFYTPKVMFSLGNLERLFEQKPFEFHSYNNIQLHDFVKSAIQDGWYIFLKVDRFFYTNGRESGKTHMFHPVFIYGFDDESNHYHCIEDCIIPGTMDYYQLPYSCVDSSCRSFIENGDAIDGMMCRTIVSLPLLLDSTTPYQEAVRMGEGLLEDGIGTEFNLLYQTGVGGLKTYAKEFTDLFVLMEEFNLFKMRILQFQQIHKRNQQLMRYLISNQQVDPKMGAKLVSQYQSLHENWEYFKRKSFGELAKKKIKHDLIKSNKETIIHLSEKLADISAMEEASASELLALCK